MGKIEFFCDGCGHRFHAEAQWLGGMVRCPECSNMVAVPEGGVSPGRTARPASKEPPVATPAAAERRATTEASRCVHHADVEGTWQCLACGEVFCEQCVKIQPVGKVRLEICPLCGGKCESVRALRGPKEGGWRAFFNEIPKALSFPFRGIGQVILVTGMMAFLFANLVPLLGLVVAVVMVGYVAAYQISVIRESAGGEDDPPSWPDFTNAVDDLIVPFFQVLGTSVVCVGPALVYLWFRGGDMNTHFFVLLIAGLAYYPMALLAVAMFGSLTAAVNLVLVLRSILRIPFQYFIACVAFFLVIEIRNLAIEYLKPQLGIFGGAVADYLMFYFMMVTMRLLGVMYRANEVRLGWFRVRRR